MKIGNLMVQFENKTQFKRLTKKLAKMNTMDFMETLFYHFDVSISYTPLVQLFESECKKREVNYHAEFYNYNNLY